MPAYAPAIAGVACIASLFWSDRKPVDGVSRAVWVPFIWMFFAGSRFASQWLELGAPGGSGTAVAFDEGSPLDRNVFLGLILAGAWILGQRRIDWTSLFRHNFCLVMFFAFAAVSALWADDPLIATKRLLKGVGNVIMVLVIATERRPDEALGYVLRRLTFLLIPLSILFIRFYPEIGRSYHMGTPMFTGVAFQKNSLGQLCLYLAIYVAWALLYGRKTGGDSRGESHTTPLVLVTPMIAWVLYMSHSATSIVLAVIAIGLLVVLRLKFFRKSPRRLFPMGVTVVLTLAALNAQTDLKESLFLLIGRDPDLTDRAPVWAMLLDMQQHPLIGAGYESFWSGARMAEVWARMGAEGTGILQAHNGYIDLYLSLGLIGVSLLMLAVLSGVGAIRRGLRSDYAGGVLRLVLVLVVLIYNYTEAAFKPLNNLFVLLLYSIVQVRVYQQAAKLGMAASKAGSQTEMAPTIGNPNDHPIGQNRRAGFR